MIILLLFAFISGLITIAAPCIWPLLPIVLSSSSLGGRRRPLGLTLGILVSFGVITLTISYLVHLLGFDASVLRTLAVIVLIAMGLTLLLPPVGQRLEALVSRFAGGASWTNAGDGFWPGFVSGLPLGVVWAPCAGPILATIATLSATREVGFSIVLVTVAYLVGIGIPLFCFSYAGQRLIRNTKAFSEYTGSLQRVFGVVMMATAALILFNWDTRLEADLLDVIPSYANLQSKLEGNSKVTEQLNQLRGIDTPKVQTTASSKDDVTVFNTNQISPDIVGINKWLNLPDGQTSLDLKQLRGKVVLIDFWTYTCINCIRTLPHVTAWYNQYKDDGLVVIGVHTPEFQFEHSTSNVQQAIQRFGIKYPVAQDNDYGTWTSFGNRYWPAEYLIDKDSKVRRVDYGEGEYNQMETAIRQLLGQAGAKLAGTPTDLPDMTPVLKTSPETYLGTDRMQYYYPKGKVQNGIYTDLKTDPKLAFSSFDLGGGWVIGSENSQARLDAALEYNFQAEHVYLVMDKPPDGNGSVKVLVDGAPVDATNAGADVQDGAITVDSDRLYDLVDLKGKPGHHILRLEFSPGVSVYAFTFG